MQELLNRVEELLGRYEEMKIENEKENQLSAVSLKHAKIKQRLDSLSYDDVHKGMFNFFHNLLHYPSDAFESFHFIFDPSNAYNSYRKLFEVPDELKENVKEKFLEVVSAMPSSHATFKCMFQQNCFRFLDRLEAVTSSGENIVIPQEVENEVLEIFKKMYLIGLDGFLDYKDSYTVHFDCFKEMLNLYRIPGTAIYNKKPMVFAKDMMTRSFLQNRRDKVKELLINWYQENHFTFVHQPDNYDFDTVSPFFYLLNKEQSTSIVEEFEKRFLESFNKFEPKANRSKQFSEKNYNKLINTKNRIKILMDFKKTIG
jgi:hypothetical protein